MNLSALVLLAAIQLPQASPGVSVSHDIGISKVTLTYHRPAVKARNVWTDLVPPGKVWRLGANNATTLELSHAARINGNEIAAGKYALFAIPGEKEWIFILNKKHAQWGAYFHDPKEDALRFSAKPEKSDFHEWFDINLVPASDRALRAEISWERVRVPFTIEFETEKLVWNQIDSAISAAPADDWETFHQAARYALTTGQRLDEAMKWIDRAMVKESFWNYELKGLLLHKAGRTEEAIPLMEKAQELAKGKAPDEYVTGLQRTVAGWRPSSSR